MPPLADTHCHLGHCPANTTELLGRAAEAGVETIVDVGIDSATTRAARERAHRFAAVHFTAGLHPCDADRLDAEWDDLATLATDARCVAVGESGFDFYWDRTSRETQLRSFERHLELAVQLQMPVIVHCRDAFERTYEVIAAHPAARCVLHCFSGGIDEARRALALGCVLSFAGPLTYPRATALREAAAFAPLDRILVETDAPFLPPQGRRGRRNEPAFVRAVAERLAEVRGASLDDIARATTANAVDVFGL